MASTYSNLKIELIGTGDQAGTWGTTTNTNLGTAIEEAITGSADVSFSSADVTLTLTNTNTAQTARNLRLNLTGTSGGARNLIVPAIEKQYIINNGLADAVTVKNSTGTGVAVPAGKSMIVFNTGSNVVEVITNTSAVVYPGAGIANSTGSAWGTSYSTTGTGTVVALATNPTLTNPTLTTPILGTPQSGTLSSCTGLPLTTGVTGTLPVANGGTNLTTYTTGDIVFASATNTLNKLADVATGNALISGGVGVAPSYGKIGLTTHVSGTLPVSNGGTGAATLTSNNVILGNGTSAVNFVAPGSSGNVLISNGTTWTAASAFVTGMIMMWSGSIATIPSGWLLCDGTNSTPDLRNRFIVGAFSDNAGVANTTITGSSTQTGGSKDAIVVSHTHTATVTDPGHFHSLPKSTQAQAGSDNGGTATTDTGTSRFPTMSSNSNTTGVSVAISTTGSSATNANLVPYYALAFIMKS